MPETQTEISPNGTPEAETSPAEEATAKKMHAFSAYLHIGPGASECPNGENGQCKEVPHFHAWCRLPNQFERKTLRDKAAAASARTLRLLRDEDSDLRVILDNELDAVVARGDKESLIEEIVGKNFLEDHLQALREVKEENEDYETIDEDRERLRALAAMPEEERPTDEYEHLSAYLPKHTELVNARREAIEKPRREAVADKPVEELRDIVREQRIEALGNAGQVEEYSKWEWYICTLKPKSPDKPGFPNERVFAHINEFTSSAPEILEAVAATITDLENEANDSLKG